MSWSAKHSKEVEKYVDANRLTMANEITELLHSEALCTAVRIVWIDFLYFYSAMLRKTLIWEGVIDDSTWRRVHLPHTIIDWIDWLHGDQAVRQG